MDLFLAVAQLPLGQECMWTVGSKHLNLAFFSGTKNVADTTHGDTNDTLADNLGKGIDSRRFRHFQF